MSSLLLLIILDIPLRFLFTGLSIAAIFSPVTYIPRPCHIRVCPLLVHMLLKAQGLCCAIISHALTLGYVYLRGSLFEGFAGFAGRVFDTRKGQWIAGLPQFMGLFLRRANHGSVNINLKKRRTNVRIGASNSELASHVTQRKICWLDCRLCHVRWTKKERKCRY